MSFETTVFNLRSPVKELVLSATKDGKEFFWHNDVDKQEVLGWIDKTTQESFLNKNNLKVCDSVCVAWDRF
jgi:aminoacyl tRNA synthase complex-interacting multifunctional protein 1